MENNNKLIKIFKKKILINYDLYILMLPVITYFVIFKYIPMYGVTIAFKKFNPVLGIMGSPYVGIKYFEQFFNSYEFIRVLKNTLGLSVYQLAVSFPVPVFLAIIINEISNKRYKKIIQTVTYAPHFISTVVIVGIIIVFLSPRTGLVNHLLDALSMERINFMGKPEWFKTIYVITNVWQNAGWGAIIFIASLSGIDIALYEAAYMDGCTRFKKIWYIDLPGIMPTIIILLILRCGQIMNLGFQKVLLMQNSLNMSSSDIIQTYVYRMGLQGGQFSYAAAVGLFNNIINVILLITVNTIARKVSENSLW